MAAMLMALADLADHVRERKPRADGRKQGGREWRWNEIGPKRRADVWLAGRACVAAQNMYGCTHKDMGCLRLDLAPVDLPYINPLSQRFVRPRNGLGDLKSMP